MSYRTPRKTPNKRSSVTPSRLQAGAVGRPMNGPPAVFPSPRATPAKAVSQNSQGEEGIQVAIRMRPLHGGEAAYRRVWKVLPKYSSVTQTTPEGEPLMERVTGRTFFTYDKTFGEEATTRQVYDNVCKNIVTSAVSGLNGTIFAYGQTSSGKTFTMQGSGTIQEGTVDHGAQAGGIVHMAATDLFEHIRNSPQRIFLVRVSFLEIYNEEVRDLLATDGANKLLKIREDPRRGVFVESREEIVIDFRSMLAILFQGEKSRAFAATAMNERSSRSHTIFRITVESRQNKKPTFSSSVADQGDENLEENHATKDDENDDGAVLISTLNLVDLAGSESVRHTGATGDRQKEGGMINQSLLTLSRVMTALGTPNQPHINFRDSKLTRLLQPALSGNARMAVICCATPSELYLEETRSTLQFAARAKLVKTSAQVNEVLDDRSLIKRLQRELAEARRNNAVGAAPEHVQALQQRAETAGTVAREAEEKLRRLQSSILNSGVLFGDSSADKDGLRNNAEGEQRKRRLSEGSLALAGRSHVGLTKHSPKTVPRPTKQRRMETIRYLDATEELPLLRQALVAKNSIVESIKHDLETAFHLIQTKESQLASATTLNETLRTECESKLEDIAQLKENMESLRIHSEEAVANHKKALEEKDSEIADSLDKLEQELMDRQAMETALDALQGEKGALLCELKSTRAAHQDEIRRISTALEDKLLAVVSENQQLSTQLATIQTVMDGATRENDTLRNKVIAMQEECRHTTLMLARAGSQRDELVKEKNCIELTLLDVKDENVSLTDRVQEIQQENHDKNRKISVLESQLADAGNDIKSLTDDRARLDHTIFSLKAKVDTLESELEVKAAEAAYQTRLANELEASLFETKSQSEDILASWESTKSFLEQAHQKINKLQITLEKNDEDVHAQQNELEAAWHRNRELVEQLDRSESHSAELSTTIADLERKANSLEQAIEISAGERDTAIAELSSTTKQVMSAQMKIEEFCHEISTLQNNHDALSAEMEKLAVQNVELQTTVLNLETKSLSTEEIVLTLSNERDEANRDLSSKSEELEYARAEIQKLSEMINTMELTHETMSDELKQTIETTANERDTIRGELSSTTDKLRLAQAKIEELCEEIRTLRSNRDALSAETEKVGFEKEELQKSIVVLETFLEETLATLSNERDESKAELLSKSEELESARTEIQKLSEMINTMESTREILSNEMKVVSYELSCTTDKLMSAQTKIDKLSDEICTLQRIHDALSAETEKVAVDREKLQKTVVDLETKSSHFEETISKLSKERDEAQADLWSKSEELEIARTQIQKLSEMVDTMERTHEILSDEMKKTIEKTAKEREGKSDELSRTTDKLMSAQAKIEDLHKAITTLQSNHDALSAKTEELTVEKDELQKTIVDLKTKSSQFEETVSKLSKERDEANTVCATTSEELESARREVKDLSEIIKTMECTHESLSNEMTRLVEERGAAASRAGELEGSIARRCEHIHMLEDELSSMTGKLSLVTDQCLRLEAEVQTLRVDLTDSKALIANLKNLEDQMSLVAAEKAAAMEQFAALDALIETKSTREQELNRTCDELRVSNSELQNKNSDQIEEILTLKLSEQKVRCQLQELEVRIEDSRAKNHNLEVRLNETNAKLSATADELISVHDMLETSTSRAKEMKQQISDLQDELESKEAMLSQSLTTFEEQRALFALQLDQERARVADLNNQCQTLSEKNRTSESEIATLRAQILREPDRFANNVGQLETEIEELKQLLSSSNVSIEEAREAALTADEELQEKEIQLAETNRQLRELRLELQKTRGENRVEGNGNDLVLEMKRIQSQKSELEQLLAIEKEARSQSEAKLKQQSGEEQREIIRQAEVSMQKLRQQLQELDQLRKNLESEAYIAREQNEELRDQNKQSIKKTIQLESEIAALRNEVGRLKHSTPRNEPDHSREAEKLALALSKVTAERNDVKNMLLALEDKMKQIESEKGKIAAELNMAHETVSRLNVPKLKEENSRLKKEIESLRIKVSSTDTQKEHGLHTDNESLRKQVDDLVRQMSSKDARIKKLELTKLKKEQVAALKKMKAEHAEYKERMKHAEKEAGELRRRLHDVTTSVAMEDTEVTKLRFDKEALENKLRKYASHCQSLEDEKANIVQVLRSTKLADVDDAGLSHIIVNLCDRLASLEEECHSLTSTKSQASSYLTELEALRERNTSLQSQIIDSRKKVDEFGRMELELKTKSAALQQELNELRRVTEKSKVDTPQSDSEQTRKVRYLEQENLQLMIDLKSTKKQLQNAKAELNTVRLHMTDDRNNEASATVLRKETTTYSLPAKDGSSSSSKYSNYAPPRVDKENRGNSSVIRDPPVGSSSSSSGPIRQRQFPGLLGEALEPNDENTQECKQS